MPIKMFDHVAHYRRDQHEVDAAIARVLASGQLVMGPDVRAFEEEFATYCGVSYAVGVTSGSAALHLALRALGIGPGDEVITVANSDIPTSHAVTLTGATVVWADIDPHTFNMDARATATVLTPRTRALLPVHLYGVPADMGPIMDLAAQHGLHVVEDAALATGGRYRGRRLGGIGTLGAFSTAPGKILDGVGSGGVVTTSDERLYDRLNSLRHYGRARPPYRDAPKDGPRWPSPTVTIGFNERLDTIDAAVLRIRLRRLDETLEVRRRLAATYAAAFEGTDVRVQAAPAESEPTWRVVTVRVPDRDRLYRELDERGYEVTMPYLPLNHLDACYEHLGYREGSLPETEAFGKELLALPCHPAMTTADAQEMADALLARL
jgi:dTDP-4-amino-4,6-dideoxygalactose transaminase